MAITPVWRGPAGVDGALDFGELTLETGAPGTDVTYAAGVMTIPRGDVGETGAAGPAWAVGPLREFAEGLVCVSGNVVHRQFPLQQITGLFRCLTASTISTANFPATPVSNAGWELVAALPWGASAEVVQFATDSEAIAYATAHPLAIVISTEGVA